MRAIAKILFVEKWNTRGEIGHVWVFCMEIHRNYFHSRYVTSPRPRTCLNTSTIFVSRSRTPRHSEMSRPVTRLPHPDGRRVAGTDGDALVLRERHSLLRVDNEPYPGRVGSQRRIVLLVDVQDQLQSFGDESVYIYYDIYSVIISKYSNICIRLSRVYI